MVKPLQHVQQERTPSGLKEFSAWILERTVGVKVVVQRAGGNSAQFPTVLRDGARPVGHQALGSGRSGASPAS